MMLGINALASYIPERRESNLQLLQQFDIDEIFVRQKLGIIHRAIKHDQETTSSMAAKALDALMLQSSIRPDQIQVLVLVTQNPDSNLPHSSAIVHDLCGLSRDCAVFDLSLGCSGYVYGLSIVLSFMRGNGMRNGILLTCDPYSTIAKSNDKNTRLLFGDAATATLISDQPIYEVGPFSFGSCGSGASSLVCNDGVLSMNGREVFNFVVTTIPGHIHRLLADAGLDISAIDRFYFHQGSRFIVDTLSKRLGLVASKVPSNLENIGNTVSSSIPLLMENEIHCAQVGRALLCGFGVGLSWGSCLLTRL